MKKAVLVKCPGKTKDIETWFASDIDDRFCIHRKMRYLTKSFTLDLKGLVPVFTAFLTGVLPCPDLTFDSEVVATSFEQIVSVQTRVSVCFTESQIRFSSPLLLGPDARATRNEFWADSILRVNCGIQKDFVERILKAVLKHNMVPDLMETNKL